MAKSYEDLVAEAKEETKQTDPETVYDALESGEDVTILDVRERNEWDEEHIKGAKFLPRGLLEYKAADELPDKDACIITHCALGGQGTLAAQSLQEIEYTNVANMEDGLKAWREKDYKTE